MTMLLAALLAAATPLRNPFWPEGYVGEREAIVEDPQVRIAAPATPPDAKAATTNAAAKANAEFKPVNMADGPGIDRLWTRARKTLRFGSTLRTDADAGRSAVTVNGKVYADGDLISVNHNGYRFTWRLQMSAATNILKLLRVKLREIPTSPEEKGSGQ